MAMFSMIQTLFPILFLLIFGLVIGTMIVTLVRGASTWNKNNHSPKLTVDATLVAKRTSVTHHHNANNMAMSHSSTSYYITFQVESGDRMEFSVSGSEYGMLAEGDRGKLSFQGSRYLEFSREF